MPKELSEIINRRRAGQSKKEKMINSDLKKNYTEN
jgi:hypothetical protein